MVGELEAHLEAMRRRSETRGRGCRTRRRLSRCIARLCPAPSCGGRGQGWRESVEGSEQDRSVDYAAARVPDRRVLDRSSESSCACSAWSETRLARARETRRLDQHGPSSLPSTTHSHLYSTARHSHEHSATSPTPWRAGHRSPQRPTAPRSPRRPPSPRRRRSPPSTTTSCAGTSRSSSRSSSAPTRATSHPCSTTRPSLTSPRRGGPPTHTLAPSTSSRRGSTAATTTTVRLDSSLLGWDRGTS